MGAKNIKKNTSLESEKNARLEMGIVSELLLIYNIYIKYRTSGYFRHSFSRSEGQLKHF